MKVNLTEAFAKIPEYWSPRIAAELNGQHVKLARLKGPFVWHHHADADELFLVHRGAFVMEFRDEPRGEATRRVELRAGELLVVPRGVEHRPVADAEVEVILFEPAGTLNTGNVTGELTREAPPWIAD